MSGAEIVGGIVSLLGATLLLLAALGLIRMPDVYNRMQAGTKATTLGTMLFLIGIAITQPGWWAKVLVLILFVIFTNPISSHALARAAHHVGIRMSSRTVRDDLADERASQDRTGANAEEAST